MNIKPEHLDSLHIDQKWYFPLLATCEKFEIKTSERVAAFIGQCQHESGGFKHLTENLNYSGDALRRVWPSRFKTDQDAAPYHRSPEKIANKVYANRMGNGDEASGDGWKYRGRGVIQLTGKSNYEAAGAFLDIKIIENPDLVSEPEFAMLTAGWFWNSRDLNKYADNKDYITLTKRINGGTIGLQDRIAHIEFALKVLG